MKDRYISENFSVKENRCRCGECSYFSADVELVAALEELRAALGRPIHVLSWFRCRGHNNRAVDVCNARGHYGAGSNDNSWHLLGAAADIQCAGFTSGQIVTTARYLFPDRYGIGLYDWGIHLDIRPVVAYWDNRTRASFE